MKYHWPSPLLAAWMFLGAAHGTNITLTANCLDPNTGMLAPMTSNTGSIALVNCLLPGGGSFTGTASVTKTDTSVLFRLTATAAVPGTFTGTSTAMMGGVFVPLLTTPYFLMGTGIERAAFSGSLTGAGNSAGGEQFAESVYGTSFNPAIAAVATFGPANAGVALPTPANGGPTVVEGLYGGTGEARLFVRYNLGAGESFTFPSSVDGLLQADTPEPGTLLTVLLGLAFTGVRASMLRRNITIRSGFRCPRTFWSAPSNALTVSNWKISSCG
jgi:hypothetical protein